MMGLAPGTAMPDVTLGHATAASRLGGCILTDVRYPAGARYPAHEHELGYLCLVLAGGFREDVGGTIEVAESGSVVVMPAGHRHADSIAGTGARSLVVTLAAGRTDVGPFAQWRMAHGGPPARAMFGLLRALREGTLNDDGVEDHVLAAADALGPERPSRSASPAVRRAEEYLRAHCDGPFHLGDVAAAVGLDRAYLARAFRGAYGCTMSEYRHRLRIRRAATLIVDQDATLAEAAARAGFADQSHLSRVFRRELGMTPRLYRRLSDPVAGTGSAAAASSSPSA